jgi:predicted AAA+ superfamily ATPase
LLNVQNVDRVNVVNVDDVNRALLRAQLDLPGLFPRLEALRSAAAVFRMEFGLDRLPAEPGVILIRGARQSGKSTWLEGAMRETVEAHGPGSALFLDGDHLRDAEHLADELVRLSHAFGRNAAVRRLFVDEITAVPGWVRGLKRVLDRGELRRVLVVTTGSHAADLRHGTERLPGRKGRLARTAYLFLPVAYGEFLRAGGNSLGERALHAYLISGGSPLACAELIGSGRISEWVVETIRDWIQGECARAGRPRRSLVTVMEQLHVHGGTPLGQTKLAKEAGLANNTVAAGWIEFLADLLCIGVAPAWDASHDALLARKPAKFPFINLLAASVWAPEAPRSASEFEALQNERQAVWHEWAVAQELFRRRALAGDHEPERIPFWQGAGHELDFVRSRAEFVEVKRGRATPLEFGWFPKVFPAARLEVVCATRFETDRIRGVTLQDFLLGG